MAKPHLDYPADPEKLPLPERVYGIHETAAFYPDSRQEYVEALPLIDKGGLTGANVWRHMEFEVRTHQEKAAHRVKRPESAIRALLHAHRENAEEAFEAVRSLEALGIAVVDAYADPDHTDTSVGDVISGEHKTAAILAARHRDLRLFAEKGPESGLNPLDIDYLDPENAAYVEARIAEAFGNADFQTVDKLVWEARADRLNKGLFHLDVLKWARNFRDRSAAGMAGAAVMKLRGMAPIPIDPDERTSPASLVAKQSA